MTEINIDYLRHMAGLDPVEYKDECPEKTGAEGNKSPFTNMNIGTGDEIVVVFNDPAAASYFQDNCSDCCPNRDGSRFKISRSKAADIDQILSDFCVNEDYYIESGNLTMSDQNWINKFKAALAEEAPPGQEDFIKSAKPEFQKKYGDDWEEVLYATAWKRHNNESIEDEEVQKILDDINYDNGYRIQKHEEAGDHGEDFFPDGQTGTAPKKVGPSAAKHGNNPLSAKQFETLDESSEKIHEDLVYKYRAHKKESAEKKSLNEARSSDVALKNDGWTYGAYGIGFYNKTIENLNIIIDHNSDYMEIYVDDDDKGVYDTIGYVNSLEVPPEKIAAAVNTEIHQYLMKNKDKLSNPKEYVFEFRASDGSTWVQGFDSFEEFQEYFGPGNYGHDYAVSEDGVQVARPISPAAKKAMSKKGLPSY
jgi:hypothetical protein